MNFSEALEQLKMGNFVYREGWNGKEMYLMLINTDHLTIPIKYGNIQDFVIIKYPCGKSYAWLCSQGDLLANDWNISEFK